jgi:hypothetical protein
MIKDCSLLTSPGKSGGGSDTAYQQAGDPWHASMILLWRNSLDRSVGVSPYLN